MSGLVRTEADYREMLDGIIASSHLPVAIDTETTGLDVLLDDHCIGISASYWTGPLSDEIESWYLPVGHSGADGVVNQDPQPLLDVLNENVRFQVFHHAIFDWLVLSQVGDYRLPGEFHDTQVAAWLIDENMPHGLKELCSILFGTDAGAEKRAISALRKGRKASDIYRELRQEEPWCNKGMAAAAREEAKRLAAESRRGWADLLATDIEQYAAKDTELTLMLMESQVGVHGTDDAAMQREFELQRVLYRMIRTGIRVNPDAVIEQASAAKVRLTELAAMFEGINLNSTKQLATLIYDEWGVPIKHRTKSGAPSTARAALEELEGHAEVRELMEFKRLSKAWSGYYVPLYEKIDDGGRIHAHFSSTRTVTGRLSCSAPNLQTIPRGDTLTGVRDVFVADDGYELWEYDLASAELRVQASLCRDTELMEALDSGVDLHARTAAMVFGPDFTGLQRRLAKNLNYGFSYGIGSRKFATYMVAGTPDSVSECAHWSWPFKKPGRPGRCRKCHVCQASDILDGYRRSMPKLVQLMKGLERVARSDGMLPLHVEGRYRHFRSPGAMVPYYTALNAIVQGGVAELMKDVMLRAEARIVDLGARLCLQVHDSLVIEVRPGSGPKVGEMLQEVLDEINPFRMRMIFDASPWEKHD